ncbi:MAG: glycogen/starch synthase [Prevotella sp.]|nr:glycogen/starch synthase [Prevotella sp.]
MLFPDYIFESSWEVCNKVGGIYTVLSTRAKTLQDVMPDKLIFIGPDFWKDTESPYFKEDKRLFAEWREKAVASGLKVRVGRWTIPSEPIAILVDFTPYFELKNDIYSWMWEHYGVDSLHAYGDYDEASMFSYAAALVVMSFYKHYLSKKDKVVYHANEWMTGLGALYINKMLPEVATIFTTHATSIGRSIAGNMKPLYDYMFAYNGDQMASELNMQSKHSIEKQTAIYVDCFTTVSDITANECKELMDKPVDVVLPNGFDNSFVPKPSTFTKKRNAARQRLLAVASALLGEQFDNNNTFIVSTSGRYEFRNKGIDVFIETMSRLRNADINKKVVAFIQVPGWVGEPRRDLQERLASGETYDTPLHTPMITHWLHNMHSDQVLGMMGHLGMQNSKNDNVKVIFMPCYLDGNDGIMDMPYYDVVLGNDLCIYPSYYEPWGYTPLEAIAFKVPCITTALAGFGLWVNSIVGHEGEIEDGVMVVKRTDYNYHEVVDNITNAVARYINMPKKAVDAIRKNAEALSKKALWSEFIAYYKEAYDIALQKAEARKAATK